MVHVRILLDVLESLDCCNSGSSPSKVRISVLLVVFSESFSRHGLAVDEPLSRLQALVDESPVSFSFVGDSCALTRV